LFFKFKKFLNENKINFSITIDFNFKTNNIKFYSI